MGITFNNSLVIGLLVSLSAIANTMCQSAVAQNSQLTVSAAQTAYKNHSANQPDFVRFINTDHAWVDSVMRNMTLKEKVAQLFMVRAHSNLGQQYIDSVAKIIEDEQLGGLVLFQGGPYGHAQVINRYQKLSKVPMLVALDGEWGLGMRMPDSTISYPYQMTLGAIQNEDLLREMGRKIAKDFRRLGMHINFAPVVDVNNNANNPVINFRSFGEDKYNVTRKSLAYMQGMMDKNLIVSLKHFPGHGDTDVDSHYDLPVLPFERSRLDSLEMYPFRELIRAGASGVMVAHMHIPSLDSTANMPSSISKPIVTDLLKEELNFEGLIFTDAMNMKGVVKFFPDGEADLKAIAAGHDLLELSENSARAVQLVLDAIANGVIDQQDIERRVRRVLAAKYWLGLNRAESAQVSLTNLYEDLNSAASKKMVKRLAEHAVTLLNGKEALNGIDTKKRTAIVSIGESEGKISVLQKSFGNAIEDKLYFILGTDATQEEIDAIRTSLNDFEQVIIAVHDSRARPRNKLDLSAPIKGFLDAEVGKEVTVCFFANPYALVDYPEIAKAGSLLIAYQNDYFMQEAVARVLLGEIEATGLLPVSVEGLDQSGR